MSTLPFPSTPSLHPDRVTEHDPDRGVLRRAGEWLAAQAGEVVSLGVGAAQQVIEHDITEWVMEQTGRPMAPQDTVDRSADRGDQGTNASAPGAVTAPLGLSPTTMIGIGLGGVGLLMLLRK